MEPLIEGEDFYWQDGLMVLTRKYLLKRGTCCDNGCANCPYGNETKKSVGPAVISMVPSWTETFIECDVNVVGRTRYCIHPQDRVARIPVVGGTKDIQWDKVTLCDADFLLLDREENPKDMADASPIPCVVSHVKNLKTIEADLMKFADLLGNEKLRLLAGRWRRLQEYQSPSGIENLPGVLEWLRRPQQELQMIYYVIWKNPWMVVSGHTFIGSLFDFLGLGPRIYQSSEPYPKIDLNAVAGPQTLLLFSSEPYPFLRQRNQLLEQFPHVPMAFVDGEVFSWFGVRSLRFLEQHLKIF